VNSEIIVCKQMLVHLFCAARDRTLSGAEIAEGVDRAVNCLIDGIRKGPEMDAWEEEQRLRARPRLRGYDHEHGD
jgi:hypothetical protein